MIRDRGQEMDIYLTGEELSRQENLFAPHEISYTPLKGREYDIRSFTVPVTQGEDMQEAPSSC
jgi:hypothetical protein